MTLEDAENDEEYHHIKNAGIRIFDDGDNCIFIFGFRKKNRCKYQHFLHINVGVCIGKKVITSKKLKDVRKKKRSKNAF